MTEDVIRTGLINTFDKQINKVKRLNNIIKV